jgi:hypothetical protein
MIGFICITGKAKLCCSFLSIPGIGPEAEKTGVEAAEMHGEWFQERVMSGMDNPAR